jgi:hypothetical protein
MMFLVRSAFWLSIVYAHMPFDGAQVARAVGAPQSNVASDAATALGSACAQNSASCRAILSVAARAALSPAAERPSEAGVRARGRATARSARPSANSLGAADQTPPWRGRQAKVSV